MDEEKVTQTAMEPAQQPKPKARGGQRTQGKTASGTGRGRMAKPHASNSNTAHRKTGTQKQKSEPQNTKSPQEPKSGRNKPSRPKLPPRNRWQPSPKRRAAGRQAANAAAKRLPPSRKQNRSNMLSPGRNPRKRRKNRKRRNLPLWPNRLKQPPRRKCRKRRCRDPKPRSCPRPRSRRSRRMTNRN